MFQFAFDCIVEDHQQHPLTKIHRAIQRGKDEIERFADNLENEELKDLEEDFDNIEDNLCQYDSDVKTVKTQINTEKEIVIKEVENRYQKMLDDVESSKEEAHNTAKDYKREIFAKKGKVRNAISQCRSALLANDSTMIHYVHRNPLPRHARLTDLISRSSPLQFEFGQLKMELGRVIDRRVPIPPREYEKAKILKSFRISYPSKSQDSQYIIKASNTESWFGYEHTDQLLLCNDEGKVIKTVKLGFEPLQVQLDSSNDFLICDYRGHKVIRMSDDGKPAVIISDLKEWPVGLCINHEGMLILGIRNTTKLHVYSQEGEKVGELGSMPNGGDVFYKPESHSSKW